MKFKRNIDNKSMGSARKVLMPYGYAKIFFLIYGKRFVCSVVQAGNQQVLRLLLYL